MREQQIEHLPSQGQIILKPRRAADVIPDVAQREARLKRIHNPEFPLDFSSKPARNTGSAVRHYNYQLPQPKARRQITLNRVILSGASIVSATLILYLIGATTVAPAVKRWQDDAAYGYPRLIRVEANVGHGDANFPNSRFIGINNSGSLEVIELPEDPEQAGKSKVYVLSQMSGGASDLDPITSIAFGSGAKPDMTVIADGFKYTLHNTGTSFTIGR